VCKIIGRGAACGTSADDEDIGRRLHRYELDSDI
jgi:hypothetical protein